VEKAELKRVFDYLKVVR